MNYEDSIDPADPMPGIMRESLAANLYETYCRAVGGRAYNGDLLPSWREFAADTNKIPQVEAWRQVADRAIILTT